MGETVYNSSDLAASVMTGIYAAIPETFDDINNSFSYKIGLLSDEFQGLDVDFPNLYLNNVFAADLDIWTKGYSQLIYRCNSLIEGVSRSNAISEASKAQLIGEAKFIRAFVYFYLVNLYGDIPLVLTSDININSNITRTSKAFVYDQIIQDLKDAQVSLSNNYLNAHLQKDEIDRVRPNRASANALLARVYLYKEMWPEAEIEASKVINDARFGLLSPEYVFEKNSRETIWALQPNQIGSDGPNTNDGKIFLTLKPSGLYRVEISQSLLDMMPNEDKRKENWVLSKTDDLGNTFQLPFKYKIGAQDFSQPAQEQNEYDIVLRISEQYLIRSESRAHQTNLTGAKDDLNAIRLRSGLGTTTANTPQEIIAEIKTERQIEFFAEWGHRWFDLKRTGDIDGVMSVVSPLKLYNGIGGSWAMFKALLPIPPAEFTLNQSLRGHQNPGYPEK